MKNFQTTQWTDIMEAKGSSSQARAALDRLCVAYYAPVLNFVRREISHHTSLYAPLEAEDLTHDFFLRVLQGEEFQHLRREAGRFRTYLLGAVKFFLAHVREKQLRLKRGGGKSSVPFDETLFKNADTTDEHDARFDRDWAETLIAGSMEELRAEAEKDGKLDQFELLRKCIIGTGTETARKTAVEQLGIENSHFKVLLSRLRKRFREKVRNRIAQTVNDPNEIGVELDYLILALND